jgi:hypothetical protein
VGQEEAGGLRKKVAQVEFNRIKVDKAKLERIRIAVENALGPGDWVVRLRGTPGNDIWRLRVQGSGINMAVVLDGAEGKHSVFEIAEAVRNIARVRNRPIGVSLS